MIKGEPTWAGTGSAAVLAWVHTPQEATSRGIVVVAPPAGREIMLSALTVRRLCIVLARAGYTAVRFGWRGSMDSQPLLPHDDAVQVWQDDVRAVLATTRTLLGVADLPTFGVGYRTGAAVLGSMLQEFDTVVSWEPVSGKNFVRQWSRLRHTVAAHVPATEGLVDLLGMALTPQQAEQFSALGVPAPTRTEDHPDTTVVEFKESDKRRAKAMFGVEPFEIRLHDDIFQQVCDFLPDTPARPVAEDLPLVVQNSWVSADGHLLHERVVEVGPEHRVGVVTWPDSAGVCGDFQGASGLFVSGGGPDGRCGSGEWPLIARSLAASGVVTLRVDRPLNGDATPVDAIRATNSYTRRSALSFRESVEWLKANGCHTVNAALLCSSAWTACFAQVNGISLGVSTVFLIGHSEWKMSEQLWAEARETYDADAPRDAPASSNRAARNVQTKLDEVCPMRPGLLGFVDRAKYFGELARSGDSAALKNALREQAVLSVRAWTPYSLWKAASRRGVMQTPEYALEPMSRESRVVVLNGPDDLPRWHETLAGRAVEKLAESGLPIRSIESDRLDHSVITATGCRTVLETLYTELVVQQNSDDNSVARV